MNNIFFSFFNFLILYIIWYIYFIIEYHFWNSNWFGMIIIFFNIIIYRHLFRIFFTRKVWIDLARKIFKLNNKIRFFELKLSWFNFPEWIWWLIVFKKTNITKKNFLVSFFFRNSDFYNYFFNFLEKNLIKKKA